MGEDYTTRRKACQRSYDTLYGAVIGNPGLLSAEKEILLRHLTTLYENLLGFLDNAIAATMNQEHPDAAEDASTASSSMPLNVSPCPDCHSRLVDLREGKRVCHYCGKER